MHDGEEDEIQSRCWRIDCRRHDHFRLCRGDAFDVLLDKAGKISGLVLGVGGFLGAGEKDVIVPFSAVKMMNKDNKTWLAIDETKDSLKAAPGFSYDRATTTWKPAK